VIDPRKNIGDALVISNDMYISDESDISKPLIMPMAVIQKWVS
jgi:hypothetical protein